MNKSKFLKRSLAALLAILMVVAMVPSALAAQVVIESVPTARVFANPGYSIWVDNKEAQWDEANNAYTAEASFDEGSTLKANFAISMIQNVANTTVTLKETGDVLENSNAQVPNAKADKKVDAFGAGTYTYTLVAEQTDDDGLVVNTTEYKLIITVTKKVKSADATIKAIKTAKMRKDDGTAIKTVRGTFDNDKGTIDIVLALDQAEPAANITNAVARTIFIPSSSDAKDVEYNETAKQLTVTAQNNSKKIYKVNFTWESAFDSFKLGDYEGKIDVKKNKASAKEIVVDLPYSFFDGDNSATGSDGSDINIAAVKKLVATWTTENSVFLNDGTTAIESGKYTPDWASPVIENSDVYSDGTTPCCTVALGSGKTIKVQTKKSGNTPIPEVTIKVRVPSKNPSAELTGIQIGNDASTPKKPGTQYRPITGTTTTVTLPAGVKKTTKRVVTVWGAEGAKVELAKNDDSTTNQKFGSDGVETISRGSATSGAGYELDLTAPLVFKVTSEDTKTTKFYTININESSTSGFPRLESVELIDGDKKVVSTGTIDHTKKEVELVVPFATGIDNDALRALTLRAKADNMSRVGFGHAEVTAVTGAEAVYDVPATVLTTDGNLTIGGISVPIAGTNSGGANDTLEKQLNTWLASAASNDWNLAINADKTGITFTAKVKGTIGGPTHAGGTPPAKEPDGATDATTEGVDPVAYAPASFTEHIYITGTALNIADTLKPSGTITVPTVNTSEVGSANTFTITAQNDNSTNKETEYKVIVKKKAANPEFKISSVKVTETSNAKYNDKTVVYNAPVSGKKIRVSTLPYALKVAHAANNGDYMRFSELEASENARVVIDVGGTKTLMVVDKDEKNCSAPFKVGQTTSNWAESGQKVIVAVYSEKTWQALVDGGLSGANDAAKAGNLSDLNGADIKYEMTATYAAAELGADLISIKSTVDPKVKAEVSSNTVAITVPGSYLDAPTKKFSLDIDLSKLATIHENTAGGAKIVPDEGKSSTPSRTEFVVKTDTLNNNKIKLYDNTTAVTDLVVVNEAKTLENTWNVSVKVNDKETSADIESISAAGFNAVKDATDPYVWNLKLSSTADKLQKLNINTTSKLANITVDGAPYNPDDYYDLGADMDITVVSEDGINVVNYTLKITDDGAAANTELSEVRAGAYNGTKGAGNAWVIKVPEGTDMSNPSLTLSTVDDSAKVSTVNGVAYTAGMTVDLSAGKTLTVVVTAADGSTGTYTITCQFGAVKPSEQYSDLPTNAGMRQWVEDAINAGLMGNTGTDADGKLTFSPKASVMRKEFAVMVARADVIAKNAGINDKDAADAYLKANYIGDKLSFTDIKGQADTYIAAIEYCKQNKIISGNPDGTFAPDRKVSRLETASMLVDWLGLDDSDKTNPSSFADWDKVSWAQGKVNAIVKADIMHGKSSTEFGVGILTREEVAVVLVGSYRIKAGTAE